MKKNKSGWKKGVELEKELKFFHYFLIFMIIVFLILFILLLIKGG